MWLKEAQKLSHDLQELRGQLAQTMEADQAGRILKVDGIGYTILHLYDWDGLWYSAEFGMSTF